MKKTLLAAVAAALLPAAAWAAMKTYQVTGPALEIRPDAIVVQKGSDKWEIAMGEAAAPADLKVGSKVTIEYTMTAKAIEVKGAKSKEPVKIKKKP
jgi:hypothetical protein